MRQVYALSVVGAMLPAVAWAATAAPPTTATVNYSATVSGACSVAAATGGAEIDLGALNAGDGRLRTIDDQTRTVATAWCNSSSTMTLTATPVVAQTFSGTPPTAFTNRVDYIATVTGWAAGQPTFATSSASNAANALEDSGPQAGSYTLTLSDFAAPGDKFLVADTSYRGTVTVTLAVQ